MTARTILIVDDDTELREALVEQLSLYDEFETIQADSATSGIAMANSVFEQNVAAAEKQRGEAMPADLKQKVRIAMNEEIGAMMTELKRTALDDAAQIYADHFTAEELRRLAVISADPVMRKSQQLMPQMLPKLAQIGLKVAEDRKPIMQQKIKEVVDQWLATQESKGTSS